VSSAQPSRYRIVVGVDLSETGDHAVQHAVLLAKQLAGSELHVSHVIAPPANPAQRLAEISSELRGKVDTLRERITALCAPASPAEQFRVECVFHVRIGEPAAALHQVAVDIDADLIVVGTHGRTGVEKLLLGSVAESLVRTAHVPVLVARPKTLAGLPRSEKLEPARPNHGPMHEGVEHRVHLEFIPRTPHISGLL
jgi:nucleotide-binding universal stress UspA family protein